MKTTKKPVQNKAAKIRALLAEGIPVEDIAQQVGVKQPYVVQVRWHWNGGKKAKKKAKAKKEASLPSPITNPKKIWEDVEAKMNAKSPREIWEAHEEQLTKEMEARQQQEEPKIKTIGDFWAVVDKGLKEDNAVNSPAHYTVGGIETIDFIEAKKLNYNLGNVVKYITRADHKGKREQDLKKALWYLTREIENSEGETW